MQLFPSSTISTFNIILNLVMGPFTNLTNQVSNTIQHVQENVIKPVVNIPLNLIRNSVTCGVYKFDAGGNDMRISAIPRGNCWNCCPVNSKLDLRFLYYNRTSRDEGIVLNHFSGAGMLKRVGFDPDLPTEIFIHGFSEASPGQSGEAIKNAYMSIGDYNIILIDWSTMSTFPWYSQAKSNVKFVAKILSQFLEVFHDSREMPIEKVHLIGFSLGSHVASFVGKYLRRDLRIPRITALDPAFPEYSLADVSRRLTPSDADYVDVIHTDAGIFGMPFSVGHADFYPNEGKALQPGCQPSYLLNEGSFVNLVIGCSHIRAWQLYAESILNLYAFPATRCKVWKGPKRECNFTVDAYLGYQNRKTFGEFYLETNTGKPSFGKSVDEQIIVE